MTPDALENPHSPRPNASASTTAVGVDPTPTEYFFQVQTPFFSSKKGGPAVKKSKKLKTPAFQSKNRWDATRSFTTTAEEEKTNKNDWTG